MKKTKVYILLNTFEGWKVVKDGKHVDSTNPLFVDKELENAKRYCEKNNLEIIRICK